MHLRQIEEIVRSAERVFAAELRIAEDILGHRHPRHPHNPERLAFTEITLFNQQKIGGIIMNFTLNKDNPSVTLLLQALKGGAILPDIDSVTGHPTLKDGSLKIGGPTTVVITQDPTNPKLVTITRADNVTNASGTISATAVNDEGNEVDGSADFAEVADPVVDNGIADALQFVPAPVVAAPVDTTQG